MTTNNADTPNMLKNNDNFNISEVNVKENNTVCKTNVANNVAQRISQDLTELWKKGELPSGMYYIEFKDGDIAKDVYAFGSWGNINEHFLKQVLAPVPTWEEYLESESHCAVYSDINKWLEEENDKLKQLLKEWIHYYPIVLYEYEDTLKTKDIIELYDRTREVLK